MAAGRGPGLPARAQQAMELLRQGLSQHEAGKISQAETLYRRALALYGDIAEGWHLLGLACLAQGDADDAVSCLERAVRKDGAQPLYHDNLGVAYARQGNYPAAVASHQKALERDPRSANTHFNLANAAHRMGDFETAEKHFRRAIEINPRDVAAISDLGVTFFRQGRVAEAEPLYREALRLDPANAGAHHNLSRLLLLRGDYAQGWREYEWRWRCDDFPSPRRNFAQPLWDGGDLAGKTILIHAEQGFGDTLQFCRYAALVAARGGRVVLECQPALVRLMKTLKGPAEIVEQGALLPHFDVHAPLLSLPHILGTTLESVPAKVPYLQVPPGVALRLPETGNPSNLKVGIVWAGSQAYGYRQERGCGIGDFAPILRDPALSVYSLQKGEAAEQALRDSPYAGQIVDLAPHLGDFADTAAAISGLDLVISSDTSVPHLAGALGKPVWLLLNARPPEWRWLEERRDSPWYPSMTIFRQGAPGDWTGAFDQVGVALAGMKKAKKAEAGA